MSALYSMAMSLDGQITVMALILWTHLSLNIFATASQIDTGFLSFLLVNNKTSQNLDSKIKRENPVQIGCIVSKKSA